MHAFALLLGQAEHWRAWEGLAESVRTGRPAFERMFGMPLFRYLERNRTAAQIFDAAMTARSASEVRAILEAYDSRTAGK